MQKALQKAEKGFRNVSADANLTNPSKVRHCAIFAEWSLLTLKDQGSNPVLGNFIEHLFNALCCIEKIKKEQVSSTLFKMKYFQAKLMEHRGGTVVSI